MTRSSVASCAQDACAISNAQQPSQCILLMTISLPRNEPTEMNRPERIARYFGVATVSKNCDGALPIDNNVSERRTKPPRRRGALRQHLPPRPVEKCQADRDGGHR